MYDNKKWSGRFSEPVAESTQVYTQSIGYDKRLAEVDIRASLAHARMLSETGLYRKKAIKRLSRVWTTFSL